MSNFFFKSLPSVKLGTRQRSYWRTAAITATFLCRGPNLTLGKEPLLTFFFCRVLFAECGTRQTLCQVEKGLCRVFLTLGKQPESGSGGTTLGSWVVQVEVRWSSSCNSRKVGGLSITTLPSMTRLLWHPSLQGCHPSTVCDANSKSMDYLMGEGSRKSNYSQTIN